MRNRMKNENFSLSHREIALILFLWDVIRIKLQTADRRWYKVLLSDERNSKPCSII